MEKELLSPNEIVLIDEKEKDEKLVITSNKTVFIDKKEEYTIQGGFYHLGKEELSMSKKSVKKEFNIKGYDKMLSRRMKITNVQECPFPYTHIKYESSVTYDKQCVIPDDYIYERKNIGIYLNEFIANYSKKSKTQWITYYLKRVRTRQEKESFKKILFEYFGPHEFGFKLNWRLTFFSASKQLSAYQKEGFHKKSADTHFQWKEMDSSDESTSDEEESNAQTKELTLINDIQDVFQALKLE